MGEGVQLLTVGTCGHEVQLLTVDSWGRGSSCLQWVHTAYMHMGQGYSYT